MDIFSLGGNEAGFATECVKAACSLAVKVEKAMVAKAIEKDDKSPVTVADFSVQALIGRELSETFPSDSLVAEESSSALKGQDGESVLDQVTGFFVDDEPEVRSRDVFDWIERGQGNPGSRFWILDPVDGTKGFLRGGQYAVALALANHGRIELGVIGCPHLDLEHGWIEGRSPQTSGTIAVAYRGRGAWVSSLEAEQLEPMNVSTCKESENATLLRSYESGHTNEEQMSAFAGNFKLKRPPIRLDSQAKYLLLAAGKGDLLLRLLPSGAPIYREKIWDQAAGSLIVEEAGGLITDLDGRNLDFTAGPMLSRNRGILASNGYLHEEALSVLRSIRA